MVAHRRGPAAFKEVVKARSAALAVTPDPLVTSNFKLVTDLAVKYRLPAIADRGEFVESGGLMSYGVDTEPLFRRGASFVAKILRGGQASDLPVEQASNFELTLNLKTAKEIGRAHV